MYCGKCGSRCNLNSKFCSSCGNPLPHDFKPAEIKKENYRPVTIITALCVIIVVFIMALIIKLAGGGTSVATNVTTDHLFDGKEHSRTVMIYMVGSNLEEDMGIASSDIASIDPDKVDLDNLNVLLYTGGTNKWHNFVSNQENAIYELTKEGFQKVQTYSKENMGDPKTLSSFLNYTYENYKTDRYDLVFYNHGAAIMGAIFDDFTGDLLSLEDLEKALSKSEFKGDNKLETILFRTCLNGTYEVAHTFKDYAYYLIASEEVTNGVALYPVLDYLNDIEVLDTPINYGEKFINSYEEMINNVDPFRSQTVPMYSIINLTKIDEVDQELEKFFKGIDLNEDYSDVIKVRSDLYQYGYTFHNYPAYDMVDMKKLVEGVDDYSTVSSESLLKAIDEAVEYNWCPDGYSNGISIYFPYRGTNIERTNLIRLYQDFDVSREYLSFIKKFYTMHSSGGKSSFQTFNISESNTIVTGNEFKLELTEEQVRDYAESTYIVFEKQDDYYMPIYSSDNTQLDGNTLKTNVTNNLVKMIDLNDSSEAYVQLTERSKGGKKSYQSTAVLFDFSDGMDTEAVNLHIEYDENTKPFIAGTSIIESDKDIISQESIDLADYDFMQITNYRYDILDDDGKYTSKWVSDKDYYLFEVNLEKGYDMKRVSLDEGDYYCVFYVYDLYGNVFYSELVSMNK